MTARRYLSPTNSAECKRCEVRRHRDELKQGGGFNNYECLDKTACAKAAQRASGLEPGELTAPDAMELRGRRLKSAFSSLDGELAAEGHYE